MCPAADTKAMSGRSFKKMSLIEFILKLLRSTNKRIEGFRCTLSQLHRITSTASWRILYLSSAVTEEQLFKTCLFVCCILHKGQWFDGAFCHLCKLEKVGNCCCNAFLTKHIKIVGRVFTCLLHLEIEDVFRFLIIDVTEASWIESVSICPSAAFMYSNFISFFALDKWLSTIRYLSVATLFCEVSFQSCLMSGLSHNNNNNNNNNNN